MPFVNATITDISDKTTESLTPNISSQINVLRDLSIKYKNMWEIATTVITAYRDHVPILCCPFNIPQRIIYG